MDLLLTAALPWPTILYTILIDEIMIVVGLAGALVASQYKWGYFVFGMVALFFIGYVLIFEARKSANHLGKDVGKTFLICGSWTVSHRSSSLLNSWLMEFQFMLWCLYPIAWGLCEGGNVISPDSEAVFYGVLDLMAKPVFGSLLLWGHKGIDPARLGLQIHDYASDPVAHRGEKKTDGQNGHSNGETTHV